MGAGASLQCAAQPYEPPTNYDTDSSLRLQTQPSISTLTSKRREEDLINGISRLSLNPPPNFIKTALTLFVDHPGIVFQLPPHAHQTIPLVLRTLDRGKLLQHVHEGRFVTIEILISVGRGEIHSTWIGKKITNNRRLYQIAPIGATEVKLILIGPDCGNYRAGEHPIHVITDTENALITISASYRVEDPFEMRLEIEAMEKERKELSIQLQELQYKYNHTDGLLNNQKKERIRHLIQTWRHRSVYPIFHAWQVYSHTRALRKQELSRKICGRIVNGQLWNAWRNWQSFVEDQQKSHLQNLLKETKYKRARQAITNWRMRSLTPVFHAWRNFSKEEKVRKQTSIQRVITRLVNGQAFDAWRRWQKFIEDEKMKSIRENLDQQRRARLTTVLNRLKNSSLSRVFLAWKSFACSSKYRNNQQADKSNFRLSEKNRIISRVIRRLENQQVYIAWRKWQSLIEDERKQKILLEKHRRAQFLIAKWKRKGIKEAFIGWRNYCSNQKSKKQVLISKIFIRLTEREKWAAFRLWKNNINELAQTEKLETMERKLRNHYARIFLGQSGKEQLNNSGALRKADEQWKHRYIQLAETYRQLLQLTVEFRHRVESEWWKSSANGNQQCTCEVCRLRPFGYSSTWHGPTLKQLLNPATTIMKRNSVSQRAGNVMICSSKGIIGWISAFDADLNQFQLRT